MSRGPSGRIVIEVDPALKRALYTELVKEGVTLKEWFMDKAERFIEDQQQPNLFEVRESEGAGHR